MKCERYHLDDVCTFIDYRGKTPPKTTNGIPLITAKIIKSGAIQEPQEFIAENYYDEWMRRGIPKKGAVVFTTEAPLGEVARIRTNDKLAFAQRVIILEANKQYLSSDYLFYALQDRVLKSRIEARSTGTTVIGIKAAELRKVEIDLPPLQEQQQIAEILCSLDDKIDLNNKINANLQQQAQAIFKSWFVNFEPFQNGEFVESELGPIPKGWSVGRLANICTYGKDKVAVSELTPENYFSTENMLANKGGYTSAASLPNVLQTTRCVPGDTLVSNIRPYFKKIVYCTMNAGCSTDVLCLRPKHPQYSTYLYNLAYSDAFFDYMVAGSKGTKMPRGDKQQIMGYPVILPPDEVIAKFYEFADAVLKKNWVASEENKKLTVLRDSLLPKLMSGELFLNEEVGS